MDKRLLKLYYAAAANLYGFVDTRDLVTIARHFGRRLTLQEARSDLKKHLTAYLHYSVIPASGGEYLVVCPLLTMDLTDEDVFKNLDHLIDETAGKPLYIPSTEESFLAYGDPLYVEPSAETEALLKYLRPRLDKKKGFSAEDLVALARAYANTNPSFEAWLKRVNDDFIHFETIDDPQTLLTLYTNFHNNNRLWSNRGYTPNELFRLAPIKGPVAMKLGPNIRASLLKGDLDLDAMRQDVANGSLPPSVKNSLLAELDDLLEQRKRQA